MIIGLCLPRILWFLRVTASLASLFSPLCLSMCVRTRLLDRPFHPPPRISGAARGWERRHLHPLSIHAPEPRVRKRERETERESSFACSLWLWSLAITSHYLGIRIHPNWEHDVFRRLRLCLRVPPETLRDCQLAISPFPFFPDTVATSNVRQQVGKDTAAIVHAIWYFVCFNANLSDDTFVFVTYLLRWCS